MSEALCQNALYRWCDGKRHRHIAPNVKMFSWEGDLASVTPHGYLVEYEIKCSRSDFLVDVKKFRHRYITQGFDPKFPAAKFPAYFYYALKDGVRYEESEVPEHAGMLRIYSQSLVTVEKEAPRLHKRKVTDDERQWLNNAVIRLYWKERLHNAMAQGT